MHARLDREPSDHLVVRLGAAAERALLRRRRSCLLSALLAAGRRALRKVAFVFSMIFGAQSNAVAGSL
jgi:hypothetical protein